MIKFFLISTIFVATFLFGHEIEEDYKINNISMNLAGKWGWLNQTPIHVLEYQAQYHINHTFISIGYEHLEIGSPDYDFAAIGFGVYLP